MTEDFSRPDRNFYPRPPRGGRPLFGDLKELDFLISIHALREEGDLGRPRYRPA